ncbi:MAG: Stealth CR1 domain-containing protein [Clostridia bacterium]|nr:Stealth CR1 domain-containing protein [Clostridia bacterium]
MGILSWLRAEIHLRAFEVSGYVLSKKLTSEPMDFPIDFVVTWVDGNDPSWKAQKLEYTSKYEKGNTEARYREWNQFHYWFRAVEKYAPWVRYVYLVTWGHVPSWIALQHPKLKIVRHDEFIPSKYLPTFSSNPIELNLHRIPGLSEHFVYFNDDIYLASSVKPEDFFCGGLPKYCGVAYPVRNYRYNGPFVHQLFSTLGIINGVFDLQSAIEKNPKLWFSCEYGQDRRYNRKAYRESYLPGMFFSHLGCPFRKSTFEKAWDELYAELDETSKQRFRTPLDILHQVFSLLEIMEGTFKPVPRSHYGVYFGELSKQSEQIEQAFLSKQHKMICLNDSIDVTLDNFERVKEELDSILLKAFPDKSSFEK